jgi:hypothetical protein
MTLIWEMSRQVDGKVRVSDLYFISARVNSDHIADSLEISRHDPKGNQSSQSVVDSLEECLSILNMKRYHFTSS